MSTPITINTFIKNVADKTLGVGMSGNPADYHFDVKTSEGEIVPVTRFGRRIESNKKTYFSRGPLFLAPGEICPDKFTLNQIFDITLPGKYDVKVSHFIKYPNEKDAKEAVSNILHIEVK